MVNDLLKVLFLVLIVIISQFVLMIDYNEMTYIPYAYTVFNPDWLSNDWTLSYRLLYLFPFSYVTGFFVNYFGFISTIFLGRIVSYIFFSVVFLKLLKAIKANFAWGCMGLMIFLIYFPHGMYAGEWIVGGLESKVFAYLFVMLALIATLKRKIGASLLYSGIALSLHTMIGGYHVICLLPVLLYRSTITKEVRIQTVLKKSYLFLAGGLIGLIGMFSYLLGQSGQELSGFAWDILVQVRNPYHNLPKIHTSALLPPFLFSLFNLTTLFFVRKKEIKDLSLYVLSSAFISFIGILIYLGGDQSLLRFYFFRFSDAIQPFLTIAIVSSLISDRLPWLTERYGKPTLFKNVIVQICVLLAFFFFLAKNELNLRSLTNPNSYTLEEIHRKSSVDFGMMSWIKNNTSKTSVIIAPIEMETFHLYAERASFVGWKSTPVEVRGTIEWYRRIQLLCKGFDLFQKNIDPKREVTKNYKKLTVEEIVEIGRLYPEVTHIIFHSPLNLSLVHKTEKYFLYEL